MAKVRDLKNFYKTVTKKCNGKCVDKIPPFSSSASGSASQAEISIIGNEINNILNLRRPIAPQFQNALRMRSANTL